MAETNALLERVPELACEAQEISVEGEPSAAVAALACEPTDEAVAALALATFEDTDVLRTEWQGSSVDGEELELSDDACTSAAPGARKWGFGNIACVVEDGTAQIRWTDSRIGLLGQAKGASEDIPELYKWWQDNARKIGRTGDSATEPPKEESEEKPDEPKVSKPGKLVRVPGAPKDITCVATGDPIPDEWDRAWRLKNISFRNRAGFERVVLNLERTGKNRTKWPTQAWVERTVASRVARTVPNALRPKLGRQAFVVQLDGVRDSPTLIRYQPDESALVKEVSVVKNGAGRAVIITAPKGTCYQMRIPVWGPNASGNEKKAEVYIDLK